MSRTHSFVIGALAGCLIFAASCRKIERAAEDQEQPKLERESVDNAIATGSVKSLTKEPNRQVSEAVRAEWRISRGIEMCLIHPLRAPRRWREAIDRYNQEVEWLRNVPSWLDTDSHDVAFFADRIEEYRKQLKAKARFLAAVKRQMARGGVRVAELGEACALADRVAERAIRARKYRDRGLIPVDDIQTLIAHLRKIAPVQKEGGQRNGWRHRSYEAMDLLAAFGNVDRVDLGIPMGSGIFHKIGAIHRWGYFHGGREDYYAKYDDVIVVDDPICEALKPSLRGWIGFMDYLAFKVSSLRFDLILFVDKESADSFWTRVTEEKIHVDGREICEGITLWRVFWPMQKVEQKIVPIQAYSKRFGESDTALLGSFEKGRLVLRRDASGPISKELVGCAFYYGRENVSLCESKLPRGGQAVFDLSLCWQRSGTITYGMGGHEGRKYLLKSIGPDDWLIGAIRHTDGGQVILELTPKRGVVNNFYTYALKAEKYLLFYCPREHGMWADWSDGERKKLRVLVRSLSRQTPLGNTRG